MKCSIINRSTICFDHLATPLQHTVDQRLYATLIQVGPGPLQNALEFLQRSIVLHLLVGFPLDVIPEVLDGVADGGSCRPFHTLNAISSRSIDCPTMLTRCWSRTSCRMQLQPSETSLSLWRTMQDLIVLESPISFWRKMALSVLNGLQDSPTAAPSRTSGITSSGKPTRR